MGAKLWNERRGSLVGPLVVVAIVVITHGPKIRPRNAIKEVLAMPMLQVGPR